MKPRHCSLKEVLICTLVELTHIDFIFLGSETSSEHSIGTHSVGSESVRSRNTLLATGNSRNVQLQKLDENMKNMTLDPGFLNPDKLWERPEAG